MNGQKKSAKELNNINKSLHHNFPPGSSNFGAGKSTKKVFVRPKEPITSSPNFLDVAFLGVYRNFREEGG